LAVTLILISMCKIGWFSENPVARTDQQFIKPHCYKIEQPNVLFIYISTLFYIKIHYGEISVLNLVPIPFPLGFYVGFF